jgi:hypothetical protein
LDAEYAERTAYIRRSFDERRKLEGESAEDTAAAPLEDPQDEAARAPMGFQAPAASPEDSQDESASSPMGFQENSAEDADADQAARPATASFPLPERPGDLLD